MEQVQLTLGVAPTRRNLFSRERALAHKDAIYRRLAQMNVKFVDIEDVGEEGLLFGEHTVSRVVEKFQKAGVDALFFPHVNFGSEDLVGKVAAKMKLPVLLWGPRDDAPLPDGTRETDSQCGLFATGKVLRRFGVPFNYMTNCALEDEVFSRGIRTFLGVANVVRELKDLRILQISTRPSDFWTMIYNEGELLERFGIQVLPVAMPVLTARVKQLELHPTQQTLDTIVYIKKNMEVCVTEVQVRTIAALTCAMRELACENGCKAIAIQCWNALQGEIGVMPCAANGILTDLGLPVTCETDIHGAITSIIAQAAALSQTPTFFADWTIRHPDNDNGELLQHCGPFPISLSRGAKKLVNPFCFADYPGAVTQELRAGDISILRFDGDNGRYSLLAAAARVVDGPFNSGSFAWVEVSNWPRLERKLVEGPYVHHCVGIYQNILPVLMEAERYLGFEVDFADENAKGDALAWLLGEK